MRQELLDRTHRHPAAVDHRERRLPVRRRAQPLHPQPHPSTPRGPARPASDLDTDADGVHVARHTHTTPTSWTSKRDARSIHITLVRIPYGIAGGLTERERQRLRRSQHASRTAQVEPAAGEAWAEGPATEWTRAQRAGTGRALLAAGRPARHVARACGVSTRTVQRWATSPDSPATPGQSEGSGTTTAGTTTPGTTGGDGATGARPPTSSDPGVGEGSDGGHRAPLGPPTSSAPWQGHEQRKDTEPR